MYLFFFFFFSSRRRHTRSYGDWSSDVCSSDLPAFQARTVEDRLEPGVIPEDERIGAAGPVAASAAPAVLPRRRRGRLRGNRRDHGEHQHTEHDLVHTAPACCVTAMLSQRPLFADFNTASVT